MQCYILDGPTPTPTDAPTCASCQAWQDELCGPPSCAANQRYQSRNCYNIEGCATTRCVSDSSCSATPTPTSCPTVTTPGELTATYNGGASSTFGWNAVSNSSTPVTYGLQIDNLGSGWTSDTCAGTVQGGDTCNLSYTGTSFTRPTNLGNSFRWRVRAKNNCGNTSNWTAWTNYNVPTPPNCTSFGGTTSIARNSSSTHQIFASGDPTRGQLAWRCGAGGTWGAWQLLGDLTQAPSYTFDFNSNVSCGNASQSQPIQMAVNLFRGSCNDDSCRTTGNPNPSGSWNVSTACLKDATLLPVTSDPQCTATLAPNPMSLSVGGVGDLFLSVTGAGSINSAIWSKTSNAFSMSSTGTNSRTITGVSSGNGTVNVNVTMLSGALCSASAGVNVTPLITCGGNIPANAAAHDTEESTPTIPVGTNWTYAANDTGTKCQYKCNANFNWIGSQCVSVTPICSLSMNGASMNLGGQATLTAVVASQSNGTVDRVDFSTSNTNIVTINPASDTTSIDGFSTTARAVGTAGQTATITARGFMGGVQRCSTTAPVSIIATPVCSGGTVYPGANATVCSGDQANLTGTTPWTRVNAAANCSSPAGSTPKCQWYCNSGTTWNASAGQCTTVYACTGTKPANTVIQDGGADETGLSSSLAWQYAAANTTRKCEYACADNHAWNGSACVPVPYICTEGEVPPGTGATVCSGDQTGLTVNTPWSRVNNAGACNATKCQWYCSAGTRWNGSACETVTSACSVSLSPSSLSMQVGQTQTVTATVANQPANATIQWQITSPYAVSLVGGSGATRTFRGEIADNTTKVRAVINVGGVEQCRSADLPVNVTPSVSYVGCNQSCNGTTSVCSGSNSCVGGVCLNSACTWDTNNCSCVPVTVWCGGTCNGTTRVCGGGLSCIGGTCQRAACPGSGATNCVCNPPMCSVSFAPPAAVVLTSGQTPAQSHTFMANVNASNGTVSRVDFSKNDVTGAINISPLLRTSSPASVTATAVGVGSATIQAVATVSGPGGTNVCGTGAAMSPNAAVTVQAPACPAPSNLLFGSDSCSLNTRVLNLDWNDVVGATRYQVQYQRTEPGTDTRTFSLNSASSQFASSSIPGDPLGLGEFRARVRVLEGNGVTCQVYDPNLWSSWVTATSGRTSVNVRVYENNNWVCGTGESVYQDEGLASGFGSQYGIGYGSGGFDLSGTASQQFTANMWKCGGTRVMGLSNPNAPWWFPCPSDVTPFTTEQVVTSADLGVTYTDVVLSASNTAKAWWQVEGGDVHSKGAISVLLPPYADSALRVATRLDGVSESAGMVSAEGGVSVSGNKVREESNWRVKSRFDATHRKEDYAYFWRLWQMPQTEAQDDGLAGGTKTPGQLVATSPQNLQLSETTKVLFANGNLRMTTGSFGTSSVVVFVKGDLTISGNVTVDDGGYLAFIVDGNIMIEPSVSLVEGVYIADGNIVVQSTKTNPTSLGTDVQFVGEGVFVGWTGVGLNRDLGEGGDGYDNNTMPAEKFVYRPDLVLNAPEEFKTTQVRMEERAPKDLYVEGYVPPAPTNTPVPGAEPTATPTPIPDDAGMNLITNGDFASDVNSWGGGQGGTISWDLGSGVYKVTDETMFNQLLQTGVTLKAGETYTLSFKAKSTNGRDISAGVLKNTSPYTIYNNGGLSNFDLSTEWQNFSGTFVASGFNGVANDVRFRFEMNKSGTVNGDRFWFDEVRLVKVE